MFVKSILAAQKDYIVMVNFAVNHASLVNENIRAAQAVGVNQSANRAQKGRITWTKSITLINAEDVRSVMEGMV